MIQYCDLVCFEDLSADDQTRKHTFPKHSRCLSLLARLHGDVHAAAPGCGTLLTSSNIPTFRLLNHHRYLALLDIQWAIGDDVQYLSSHGQSTESIVGSTV